MNSRIGNLLKKKSVKIIIGIAALLLIGSYFFGGEEKVEYVIAEAVIDDLIQTVSVTGTIKADPSIDLHFQKTGKIKEILVEEGDFVTNDQLLASLENEALELEISRMKANLDYSNANYNQTKAGAKYEEILISEADVLSTQAAYDAALIEQANTEKIGWQNTDLAELAYKQAEEIEAAAEQEYLNTKELAEKEIENLNLGGNNTQTLALDNAYQSAKIQLDSIFPVLQDSLFLAEDAIGVRGTGYILLASSKKRQIENIYHTPAENNYDQALETYQNLSSPPTYEEMDTAILEALTAANSTLVLLSQIGYELEQLPYTRNDLAALILDISSQTTSLATPTLSLQDAQTNIETLKAGSTQDTDTLTLNYQLQIDAAESKYNTAKNALDEAAFNLDQSKLNAEIANNNATALVALKKASIDSAIASLALKRSPARGVDLAPLLAQISQSEIALRMAERDYRDSQLYSPVDAQVTFIYGEVGENISLTETSISPFMTLHAENLIVEANVPETDIIKIESGDLVSMTLDAFDFTEKFTGDIVYIDPAETVIQGVIYYKIKSAFSGKDERIKSGMTVNLEIETDKKSDILIIPIRALKYEDSIKYVEVLNNGKPEKTNITTGIETDQYVEILSGLKEGDKVITFVK